MCIRDRDDAGRVLGVNVAKRLDGEQVSFLIPAEFAQALVCLLYTSDAADDLLCVDLGGRRIIKKKKHDKKKRTN